MIGSSAETDWPSSTTHLMMVASAYRSRLIWVEESPWMYCPEGLKGSQRHSRPERQQDNGCQSILNVINNSTSRIHPKSNAYLSRSSRLPLVDRPCAGQSPPKNRPSQSGKTLRPLPTTMKANPRLSTGHHIPRRSTRRFIRTHHARGPAERMSKLHATSTRRFARRRSRCPSPSAPYESRASGALSGGALPKRPIARSGPP